jgi:hypothetical protein
MMSDQTTNQELRAMLWRDANVQNSGDPICQPLLRKILMMA